MTTTAAAPCAACGRAVPVEDVDENTCFGCNAVICERHRGDPWGSHAPEDHLSDEDDDDDD